MIAFPNAKINIGLNIVSKRHDGYHNLNTVFYPVPLNDVLEIIDSPDGNTSFTLVDAAQNQDQNLLENNLCLRAYRLLQNDYSLPPVHIVLKKNIPTGGGLGGGSSDSAFTLKLLNQKFELQLTANQLAGYALQLGADCPFFIFNTPHFAQGIGETLSPASLSLKGQWICLVFPQIHISTPEAFRNITPKTPAFNLQNISAWAKNEWKEKVTNDFEPPVFSMFPQLAEIKSQLYTSGAWYAAMSGTGSTVYGLFEQQVEISFPNHYKVKWLLLE